MVETIELRYNLSMVFSGIILGIDPGLERTGYGLIEYNEAANRPYELRAHGVFSLSRTLPLHERLFSLYEQLADFLKLYHPSVIILEELYSHYEHPTTAILMGHARGVVCLAATQHRIPLIGYGATRVKKAITGNGSASKEQMHRMICHLLGLEGLSGPWDVTDALALAITHADGMKHDFAIQRQT